MTQITITEAIRILDPETSANELWKYEYYGGFSGREAGVAACEKACVIACNIMSKALKEGWVVDEEQ